MNEKANIIDLLDEVGMLNLGLAELISAEVLIDIDSCMKAEERLERFKRDLPSSRKKDDEHVKKILKDAESIIEHDLQEYLTQKMLNNLKKCTMSYGYNEKEIERDRIVIMDAKWLMPDANKEVSGSAIFLKIQCYGGYEKTKYIFITDDKSITKDCVNETVEKLWPYKKERVYKFIQYDGSETEAVRKATENLPEDAIYMVFLEENLYKQFPGRAEVLDIQNIDDSINKLTRQLKLGYWWDQSYRHSKLRWKDQLVSDEFENVIFLDIDGVLNDDKGDGNIDEEKVALLADIVNQTKSEIVLTSSWRRYLPEWIASKEKPKGSASMLFHLFAKYNLTIADATEDLTSGPDARPFEVRSWLSYRDSVINFVILDDESFWRWNWLAPHVVLTEVTWLGDKGNYDYHRQAGLNQEQANRAIEILQRFKKKKPW